MNQIIKEGSITGYICQRCGALCGVLYPERLTEDNVPDICLSCQLELEGFEYEDDETDD